MEKKYNGYEISYRSAAVSYTHLEGVNVYLTIDREQEGWDGHVGFVPTYLKEIGFTTDKVALVCGPPIMIKFVLAGLQEMGFTKEQVYTCLLYTSWICQRYSVL